MSDIIPLQEIFKTTFRLFNFNEQPISSAQIINIANGMDNAKFIKILDYHNGKELLHCCIQNGKITFIKSIIKNASEMVNQIIDELKQFSNILK